VEKNTDPDRVVIGERMLSKVLNCLDAWNLDHEAAMVLNHLVKYNPNLATNGRVLSSVRRRQITIDAIAQRSQITENRRRIARQRVDMLKRRSPLLTHVALAGGVVPHSEGHGLDMVVQVTHPSTLWLEWQVSTAWILALQSHLRHRVPRSSDQVHLRQVLDLACQKTRQYRPLHCKPSQRFIAREGRRLVRFFASREAKSFIDVLAFFHERVEALQQSPVFVIVPESSVGKIA